MDTIIGMAMKIKKPTLHYRKSEMNYTGLKVVVAYERLNRSGRAVCERVYIRENKHMITSRQQTVDRYLVVSEADTGIERVEFRTLGEEPFKYIKDARQRIYKIVAHDRWFQVYPKRKAR